ncbi:MAG: hypothetical protein EOO15_06420 [Chitinophagaceae bacterium]|nr:MAG: hypothetical protein EOO15_06420 [Chitinophagaceae bacterium]
MKKVAITNEVLAQWTALAVEQLGSGWSHADVRRHLTREGCTPKLLDEIMKTAKRHTLASDRRAGVRTFAVGVSLIVVGAAVILVQQFVFRGAHTIVVPSGAIFCGLACCLRGTLKGVFG